MSISKKDFIALADYIRGWNITQSSPLQDAFTDKPFTAAQIEHLAKFCLAQNSNFNRERWMDYVAGNCGPNGGQR